MKQLNLHPARTQEPVDLTPPGNTEMPPRACVIAFISSWGETAVKSVALIPGRKRRVTNTRHERIWKAHTF